MDPRTLGDVQGMSVAPRWDGSGTTAIKWFLDFRAWERDWMYGLTDAMRRAVLLSLIPASRSNPLKEMVNRYQFRYQDLLREVTEEVFTECNGIAIPVRIAGSCILTKHPSGSRTNSNPRKLGRAAKRSPLRKEVAKEKDHTKVGSFRLARAAGACCIRRRIVGRSIRSCGRKPRPRGGSVSDTTEKVAGNAGNPRGWTRLVGIWAPHRRQYAPLCG